MPASRSREARLRNLVEKHERWRTQECLNLLASENLSSPTTQAYLSSDLGRRYTLPLDQTLHGEKVDNGYAGTRFTDEIEALAAESAARLLHGKFASVRPLSGHIAAMCVLAPLLPRGARYLAVTPEDGGYDGYAPAYLPQLLGHTSLPLPLHGPTHRAEAPELVALIRREKPHAVVLGQSFFLFPYPVKEIAEAAHAVGALVLYDASHVLGLVMGGEFQDPLGEGADVVYGSTHKSFFGPQGGLLATRREDLFRQIDSALTWRVLDNAHWNRIAALAQALLEMERVGKAYASRVVANSRALGAALDAEGVPVLGREDRYSASHQIFLDGATLKARHGMGPPALARRLEEENLIIDLVGRMGTAEVSRLGLTPKEMPRVAAWVRRAGLEGEAVGREVTAFRKRFRRPAFL
jgi:glycine hydroxymethyltransferase